MLEAAISSWERPRAGRGDRLRGRELKTAMGPLLPVPSAVPAPSGRDERRALEHALVNAFLENIPDGVYFKDRNSRFIAVSKSKAIRHGFPRSQDLVGKTDADFFSESHARRAKEDEENVMRTGTPIVGKVEKLTWPDGRSTWARSSKLPLHGEQGQIIGTFGMSQDITAAKEREAAREEAHKEIMDASRMAGMKPRSRRGSCTTSATSSTASMSPPPSSPRACASRSPTAWGRSPPCCGSTPGISPSS